MLTDDYLTGLLVKVYGEVIIDLTWIKLGKIYTIEAT